MGLIDKLSSTLLDTGKGAENHDELIAPLVTIFEKQEGLAGLVDMFLRHDMDSVVTSWAKGGSVPDTAEAVEHTFGSAFIEEYAGKLGIAPAEATNHLAEYMPRYIDALIEKGEWAKPSDYVDTAIEVLKTKTIN